MLALSLDGTPVLATSVNLGDLLDLNQGQSAWAGFITSTGAFSENNDILSWSFTDAAPEPANLVAAASGLSLLSGVFIRRRRSSGAQVKEASDIRH
jgi:hypothetical protein